VKAVIEKELQGSNEQDTTKASIEHRILSSRILAKQIDDTVLALRSIFVPPTEELSKEVQPKAKGLGLKAPAKKAKARAASMSPESPEASNPREKEVDEDVEMHSDEGSDQESRSDTPMSPKPPKKSQKRASIPQSSSIQDTVLLPSLSVGFTRGDSDASSAWSDEDADEPVMKKNRRGQRARKA